MFMRSTFNKGDTVQLAGIRDYYGMLQAEAINLRLGKALEGGANGYVHELPTGRSQVSYLFKASSQFDAESMQRYARVRHPALLPIIAAGEVLGKKHFHGYILPFISGRSLGSSLEAAGRYDEETVQRIMVTVSSAVCALADQKLVNRDISPRNMIVRPDGTLMLIDMDNCRYAGFEGDHRCCDFAPYDAPSSPTSLADDVYGMGMNIYYLCKGTMPTESQIQTGRFQDLYRCAPSLAPIALAALSTRPERRPSAYEFHRSLQTTTIVMTQGFVF
jgi:serine/threonine protein kinase